MDRCGDCCFCLSQGGADATLDCGLRRWPEVGFGEIAVDLPDERIMPIPLIWYITVAFGLLLWSVVAAQYIWPAISKRERAEALRPILVLHGFRYIGMIFLVPGVVSAEIADTVFARGVAYGDLLTATLAFIALAALRSRFAEPLVWLFNIVGTLDLLNAFYQGNAISLANAPGVLGAAYFIPIFGVPLLLVTHVLVFRLLMRKQAAAPASVVAELPK
jgi:hypothetical protein